MNKYCVVIPEVWNREFIVEAENEEEAKDLAHDKASSDEGDFEYAFNLDTIVDILEEEFVGKIEIKEVCDCNEYDIDGEELGAKENKS